MGDGGCIREICIIDKSADENLVNDAVLNNDSEISYPLVANDDIHWELYAFFNAGVGGIQCAMSGPAAPTALHYSVNLDIAGANKVTSNVAVAWDTVALNAAASSGAIRIVGLVHNAANVGNLVFRWAQNAANPANTTIYQGSYLRIWRVV